MSETPNLKGSQGFTVARSNVENVTVRVPAEPNIVYEIKEYDFDRLANCSDASSWVGWTTFFIGIFVSSGSTLLTLDFTKVQAAAQSVFFFTLILGFVAGLLCGQQAYLKTKIHKDLSAKYREQRTKIQDQWMQFKANASDLAEHN